MCHKDIEEKAAVADWHAVRCIYIYVLSTFGSQCFSKDPEIADVKEDTSHYAQELIKSEI